jgi:hypothetical protein
MELATLKHTNRNNKGCIVKRKVRLYLAVQAQGKLQLRDIKDRMNANVWR